MLLIALIAGIPLWGQFPAARKEAGGIQRKQPPLTTPQPQADQRGTKESPLIIETHNRPDSPEEAAKHKAENDTKEYRDRWTLRLAVVSILFTGIMAIFTAGLLVVGWRGVNAARATLGAIQQQVDHMAIQSDILGPRLHIEGVRVSDFEVGKQPWFFIKVTNSGPKAAEDVMISMRVESGLSTGTVGAKWKKEQTVTIPANSSRKYFIKWAERLTDDAYQGFKMFVPLSVSGYYKMRETQQVEYCYKYNPCIEPRPKGVPEFIPCDFDPGLTVLIGARGSAHGKATVTGTLTNADDETPSPPEPGAN